jgi:hypothetical protein
VKDLATGSQQAVPLTEVAAYLQGT